MKIRQVLLVSAAVATLSGTAQAENVLKWGANRDIGSLDPYSFGDSFTINVLNHVYEGLVRYDADLAIEGRMLGDNAVVLLQGHFRNAVFADSIDIRYAKV